MLVFVAVVVQVGFAGYGAFAAAGDIEDKGAVVDEDMFVDRFDPHIGFGYLVILLGLILLIARAGRGQWRIKHSAILFGLLVLQFSSPGSASSRRTSASSTRSTRSCIFGLSGWIAMTEWQCAAAHRRAAQPTSRGDLAPTAASNS